MKYWKECTICQGEGEIRDDMSGSLLGRCGVYPPRDQNGHAWFYFKSDTFRCCADCLYIERKDGKNSPCKGKVKVELRTESIRDTLGDENG